MELLILITLLMELFIYSTILIGMLILFNNINGFVNLIRIFMELFILFNNINGIVNFIYYLLHWFGGRILLFYWKKFHERIEFFHKLKLYNPCIFATQWFRPLILQTMNAIRLSNLSIKYPRLALWDCKDAGITIPLLRINQIERIL